MRNWRLQACAMVAGMFTTSGAFITACGTAERALGDAGRLQKKLHRSGGVSRNNAGARRRDCRCRPEWGPRLGVEHLRSSGHQSAPDELPRLDAFQWPALLG